MKKTMKTKMHVLMSCMFAMLMCSVSGEDNTPDILDFLPLFERNSIGRKILDVRYSHKYENFDGCGSGKRDMRLVFDADTEKYREEIKDYNSPDNTDIYEFIVQLWDGNKNVLWKRSVSKKPGSRALGNDVYESTGVAVIESPSSSQVPSFMEFCYWDDAPVAKVISGCSPRLAPLKGDEISIEAGYRKFLFSKKTGALVKIILYQSNPDPHNKEMMIRTTHDLSNHVERSGCLIPLRMVRMLYGFNGELSQRDEYSADPQTLRLLDKIDDALFIEKLPAGVNVVDKISRRSYTLTAMDEKPNSVEAVEQILEKMLKQAEDQKAAVEQKK